MRKINLIHWLCVLTLLTSFVACKNGGPKIGADGKVDNINLLPADAAAAVSFDIKSIMEKADYESVKEMSFFKKMVEEQNSTNPVLGALLMDPVGLGININSKAYGFSKIGENKNSVIMGTLFSLSDATAFSGLISKEDLDVVSKSGYSLARIDKNVLLAWTDKVGFIGSVSGDMKGELEDILKGTKKENLSENKDAVNALKGDMAVWFSSNPIAPAIRSEVPPITWMMLGASGITQEALNDNTFSGFSNFEDGQVTYHADYNLNKEFKNNFGIVLKDKPTSNFAKYISEDNLGMCAAFAFSMDGLYQTLKEKQMLGAFVENQLSKEGFTMKDMVEGFTGDIGMAAYAPSKDEIPVFQLLIALKDRSVVDRLLAAGENSGLVKKESKDLYQLRGEGFSKMLENMIDELDISDLNVDGEGNTFLSVKKDMIVLSTNKDYLNKAGLGNRVGGKAKDILTKNLFGMYMDYSQFEKYTPDGMRNDISYYEIQADSKKMDAIVKFKEGKENVMKSFFEMVEENYKMSQKGEQSPI